MIGAIEEAIIHDDYSPSINYLYTVDAWPLVPMSISQKQPAQRMRRPNQMNCLITNVFKSI